MGLSKIQHIEMLVSQMALKRAEGWSEQNYDDKCIIISLSWMSFSRVTAKHSPLYCLLDRAL